MKGSVFFIVLFASTSLFAQDNGWDGWEANQDDIDYWKNERPQYIWEESEVPDYELPNPLVMPDGTMIENKGQWREHRHQLLDLFRTEMFGHSPGLPEQITFNVNETPDVMGGKATRRIITVASEHEGRTHEFDIVLFIPNDRVRPAPAFLLMNNRNPNNTDPTRAHKSGFWPAEEVVERGYAIAAIQNQDLAIDTQEDFHRGVIRLFEGTGLVTGVRPKDAWTALAAWGWGAKRVMDYFETDPEIDESRVAVLGHSRGGKASLWAAAEDQRFALAISNNSGAGGAALSKREFGETIAAVNNMWHWFNGNFKKYNDKEDELPFDQHQLVSLIAPRATYIASADTDLWADPRGEFLSLAHASPVYGLWNHKSIDPDKMPPLDSPANYGHCGYHVRSGDHNLTPTDWHHFMDFADALWPLAAVSSEQDPEKASGPSLDQNYPNPFNPTTTIRYNMPQSGGLKLEVLDILGRRIATLVDGHKKAGNHTATFDGTGLSSGIYVYRIQTVDYVNTRTMTMVK